MSGWLEDDSRCIHHLFSEQAARSGPRVALEYGDARMTYADLEESSNRLAQHLRTLGVGPDVFVALCVERSLHMLVGIFAIMKAGGAYVPMDPAYPDEHWSFVFSDMKPPIVLTQASLFSRVSRYGAHVICLDEESFRWAPLPPTVPRSGVTPDHAAYVIYTSGSTGRPKGVVVEHRGLVGRISTLQAALPVTSEDRILQHVSIAFDGAVYEWFWALFGGATLVLRSPSRGVDELLATGGISGAFLPPAIASVLPCRAPALRQLVFSGDRAPIDVVKRWAVGRKLVNIYGPTEFSIWATSYDYDPASPDAFPIGRPLPGVRVYLLDDARCAVPPGATGEICLAGAGIARGYLGRPDLTAERFPRDPFSNVPGARMYRTGDLGRWDDRGELEFLGRTDHQVKISGFRVELAEIESALEAHPSVRASAVIVRDDNAAGKHLIAYVAAERDRCTPAALKQFLRTKLPEHMVPRSFEFLDALPLTVNGKVDRVTLSATALAGPTTLVRGEHQARGTAVTQTHAQDRRIAMVRHVLEQVGQLLHVEPSSLDRNTPIKELLDSLLILKLRAQLEASVAVPVPMSALFTYPTLAALSEYLVLRAHPDARAADMDVGSTSEAPSTTPSGSARTEPIAIIGMASRFPGGGAGPEAFFLALQGGMDAIRPLPRERWPSEALAEDPSVPPCAGLLDDIDKFDAAFFGISPREAVQLDPQQRLLLEVAWEAIERSGQPAERLFGSRTGVFIGLSSADYEQRIREAGDVDAYSGTGNAASTAAGRISYVLGLQGPSISVDTACSSSLVAVHLACQSLRAGESGLAIAGGVNVLLDPVRTRMMARMQALSPEGRCKTFDARADGYVRAEGCGVVVLKRLSEAERDGDPILAVILGSAVNQDGRSSGLTAPSVRAQEAMLRQALEHAHVPAEDIGYIETHGTGTPLGDPIEFEALRAVLGAPRRDGAPCHLGAVKTNVGHMESAAGIGGLIKAVLCVRQGILPGNLHFEVLNPQISLEGTPFVIPTKTVEWDTRGKPRRAGVSAFGVSGTNAHVVIGEAPRAAEPSAQAWEDTCHLLPISAKTPEALLARVAAYRGWLVEADAPLSDIAYTASVRRSHHEQRLSVVGTSRQEIAAALDAYVRGERHAGLLEGRAPADPPRILFVFSGQGSQWVGMCRQLLHREPVFHEEMAACDEALRRAAGFSVIEELHAPEDRSRLGQMDVVQPVLFAIQVALASLWQSWGVVPEAVVGHSMGEVAAAHVAGALSREDAAAIISHRSRLLRKVRGEGAMALVELSVADAERALGGHAPRLVVAASNGPRSTLIAGESTALAEVLAGLEAQGVFCRILKVEVASHSPQVDPVLDELIATLAGVSPRPTRIPMWSTVTAALVRGDELGAEYWAANVRRPVLFSDVVAQCIRGRQTLFLEMSPHPILCPSIEEQLRVDRADGAALASLRRGQDERACLLGSLGALHVRGQPIDFRRLYPGGRVTSLPTYPWQRKRYWIHDGVPQPIPPASRVNGASPDPGSSPSPSTAPCTLGEQEAPRAPSSPLDALGDMPADERRRRLEDHLAEYAAMVLRMDVSAIDRDAALPRLGMDSMMSLELRNRIEASTKVRLSAAMLFAYPSVRELASHLLEKALGLPRLETASGPNEVTSGHHGPGASSPWMHGPSPRTDARVRLYCFPYAGGGASWYARWPTLLPSWIEVCPIQLPGREERIREPALCDVERLVDALVDVLDGSVERPFALFGYSVGGLVAFELASRLCKRRGVTPAHLFLAAIAPPDRLPPTRHRLAELMSTEETEREALHMMQKMGMSSPSLSTNHEDWEAVRPALRADLTALSRYRSGNTSPLPCPITAFGGREDPIVSREDLLAWHALTTNAFRLVTAPGAHLSLDIRTMGLHITRDLFHGS
ncbi:polyketide synthase [Polyangium sorediatum]|uniref:Amino acid adenylation domain-containing protein n=1 Tax=Polyangium sorediatum TaxID=889274 RepID=A0ABT6P4X7_9BACT|nr:polyketide synthase [Polyangium sorediatum]MDI1435671.1 amino acid adenylation domain-containing protein [Polyangium sorediatum]